MGPTGKVYSKPPQQQTFHQQVRSSLDTISSRLLLIPLVCVCRETGGIYMPVIKDRVNLATPQVIRRGLTHPMYTID